MKKIMTPIHMCRACKSEKFTKLFSLGTQFVSDFVDLNDVYNGIQCPIELVMCDECTLVQQRYTAPQDFMYTRHYWYVSGTTALMRAALYNVAQCATFMASLRSGDVVLDIGSNDGTLLRAYTIPGLIKVGVEPANNLATEENYKGLTLIHNFWSVNAYQEVMGDRKARVITACGMLYDLEDPTSFISNIAKILAPDGIFIAQLMCLKQTLDCRDIGNYAHEHLEFYSLLSLGNILGRCDLEIFDIEENLVNGGSYRFYIRHKNHNSKRLALYDVARLNQVFVDEEYLLSPETYKMHYAEMEENRNRCMAFLQKEVDYRKKIWVYGSSTKGNVILQWYGLDSSIIKAAADRSPAKWGKYTIGTGIRITSEAEFRTVAPDYALVLPYGFIGEFVERESAWRANGGKFIVPLPEFKVI